MVPLSRVKVCRPRAPGQVAERGKADSILQEAVENLRESDRSQVLCRHVETASVRDSAVNGTWVILRTGKTGEHLPKYLNQDLGFDEVRWATLRKTSYDSRASFHGAPEKKLLPPGTRLYRLVALTNGRYFDGVWWIPKSTFDQLHDDANRAGHGGGRLFRNYVAQYMALPAGASQLCVVEIELIQSVYAWVGNSSALFDRPGGMQQVFLPNLADRDDARTSPHARLVHTYWLKF